MTIETALESLGMGKNEAIVYSTLFELGKVKAGHIITHTKLHRGLVYTALEALCEKRFVGRVVEKGVTVFWALSPNTIVEDVDHKKTIAKKVAAALKAKRIGQPLELRLFQGYEGILEAREVVHKLKRGDVCYAFGGSPIMYDPTLSTQWRSDSELRRARGVNLKMLCDVTVPEGYLNRKNKDAHTVVKRLPIPAPLPAMFEMFGDVLNITVPGKEPVTLSVKSPEAAEAMKKFFEYFWGEANKKPLL